MLCAHSPAGGALGRSKAGHSSERTTCNYNRDRSGVELPACRQAKQPDFGEPLVIRTERRRADSEKRFPATSAPAVYPVRVELGKGMSPPGIELPNGLTLGPVARRLQVPAAKPVASLLGLEQVSVRRRSAIGAVADGRWFSWCLKPHSRNALGIPATIPTSAREHGEVSVAAKPVRNPPSSSARMGASFSPACDGYQARIL